MEEADYVIVEFMNREHGRVEIETGFNNVAHLDFKDNEMEFDITVTITPRK